MGLSSSTFHKKLLPGQKNQFKEGSQVSIWQINENECKVFVISKATIERVIGDGSKYDCVTTSGEHLKNVPYFLLTYPNAERKWKDYFVSGQRCLFNEIYPCIILDVNDDGVSIRRIEDDLVVMNVRPNKLRFDYTYFMS